MDIINNTEYENYKSKTTFYPRTQKVFKIKVVLFFWTGQLFHGKIAI